MLIIKNSNNNNNNNIKVKKCLLMRNKKKNLKVFHLYLKINYFIILLFVKIGAVSGVGGGFGGIFKIFSKNKEKE